MPPAPSSETTSYDPSRVPGVSGIDSQPAFVCRGNQANYTRQRPISCTDWCAKNLRELRVLRGPNFESFVAAFFVARMVSSSHGSEGLLDRRPGTTTGKVSAP